MTLEAREPGGLLLTCDIYKDNVLVRRESLQTARTKNVIKVGRLPSASLRLDHDGVSRMHAVIEVAGDDVGGYEVQAIDLGSASGTFVTSARDEVTRRAPRSIIKRRLFSGDRMQIGPFTVIVYSTARPRHRSSRRSSSRPHATRSTRR
jgi:pSer/pThr/pTyr-binding forkhead associated (FHA) protein